MAFCRRMWRTEQSMMGSSGQFFAFNRTFWIHFLTQGKQLDWHTLVRDGRAAFITSSVCDVSHVRIMKIEGAFLISQSISKHRLFLWKLWITINNYTLNYSGAFNSESHWTITNFFSCPYAFKLFNKIWTHQITTTIIAHGYILLKHLENRSWPAYCLLLPRSMTLSSSPLSRNWISFSCKSCAILTCCLLTRISSRCTWALRRACSWRQFSRAYRVTCILFSWKVNAPSKLDKLMIQICPWLPFQNVFPTGK